MNNYEGNFHGRGRRVCIAVSRFNDLVTSRLVEGALDGLSRHGVNPDDIDLVRVPGAWELPQVCRRAVHAPLGDGYRYQGVIALGAVIRGESAHFDYVCAEVSKGIASLQDQDHSAVIFGVLTCNHLAEAMDRAGGKAGNKGFEAALACLEMMNVLGNLDLVWGKP